MTPEEAKSTLTRGDLERLRDAALKRRLRAQKRQPQPDDRRVFELD